MSNAVGRDGRWKISSEIYAQRITVNDVPGFLSSQLVIEPGTKALITENGVFLGEVGAGTYTLESFMEKLKSLGTLKQVCAVLVREDVVSLTLDIKELRTADNLLVNGKVTLSVKIEDTALFLKNLMGTRNVVSTDDLRRDILPLVVSALTESIQRLSIMDLTSPESQKNLDATLAETLRLALTRYGLVFMGVNFSQIKHERYDEHRNSLGEVWLRGTRLDVEKQLLEVYTEEELQKIKKREVDTEMEMLRAQIEEDKLEGTLAVRVRRMEIRKKWRDMINADKFNEISSENELANMLQEKDKGKIIRQEEMVAFLQTYEQEKEDKKLARTQLLRILDLQQRHELDEITRDLNHASKIAALKQQYELALLTESEGNKLWAAQIAQRIKEEDTEYERRKIQTQRDQEEAIKKSAFLRAEEWEQLIHTMRVKEKTREIEYEDAKHKKALAELELDLERQKQELEDARNERIRKLQLDYLARVQEINRLENEHSHRMKMEERTLETSTELEKTRIQAASDSERTRLEGRLEGQQAHADQQIKAQEALFQLARETTTNLTDVLKMQASHPTQVFQPMMGGMGTMTGFPAGIGTESMVRCPGCSTDNSPTARYCSRCGKELK